MQVQVVERAFNYNSVALADPAPGMSPEQVRDFYAAMYADSGGRRPRFRCDGDRHSAGIATAIPEHGDRQPDVVAR